MFCNIWIARCTSNIVTFRAFYNVAKQTCARIYLFFVRFCWSLLQLQRLFSFQTSNGTADSANNKQQHPQPAAVAVQPKPEQKPVECNLCHRKFKNVPALNGHMRLHGGYFKKVSTVSPEFEYTGPAVSLTKHILLNVHSTHRYMFARLDGP